MPYLYTIECKNSCFYVGTTTKPPKERFEQHKNGRGAKWTRLNPPIKIINVRELSGGEVEARFAEDMEVKKLMLRYGIDKVRGGSYAIPQLLPCNVRSLQRELWHAENRCTRCGRKSHWVSDCFARKDVNGHSIGVAVPVNASPPPPPPPPPPAAPAALPLPLEWLSRTMFCCHKTKLF